MSSAKAHRLGEIAYELITIAGDLNAKLRVLGDDEQIDKTLAFIRAKGLSPADVYTALVDTYGAPVEEAIPA